MLNKKYKKIFLYKNNENNEWLKALNSTEISKAHLKQYIEFLVQELCECPKWIWKEHFKNEHSTY